MSSITQTAIITGAGSGIGFAVASSFVRAGGYLEAAVTMAAVARELGVNALVNMSQMTVSQMSIQNTTPSPQQRPHWLSANVCLIHQ
jgi:NAD(P)-dependent dehydrogenase (short-subunit alcohol dehydrogenase family)